MDKKEMLNKFCALLEEVKQSHEPEDIDVSLKMFKKVVHILAEESPRSMKEFVECFEGTLKYYNYLTESEALSIVSAFVNQDGSRGARWKDSVNFFEEIKAKGHEIECEPHFNKWALYVTVNMCSSDQHSTIMKWVGSDREKYMEACYDLAVNKLKDKDKMSWIREYFGVCTLT